MKAEEAARLSYEVNLYEIGKYKEVIDAIIEATNKGKYSCSIDGGINYDLKRKLIYDGYKVEMGGRYNEVDTYISWEYLKK